MYVSRGSCLVTVANLSFAGIPDPNQKAPPTLWVPTSRGPDLDHACLCLLLPASLCIHIYIYIYLQREKCHNKSKMVHNCKGYAARDPSGQMSPYDFDRREGAFPGP